LRFSGSDYLEKIIVGLIFLGRKSTVDLKNTFCFGKKGPDIKNIIALLGKDHHMGLTK
jgi:hypothetical protein